MLRRKLYEDSDLALSVSLFGTDLCFVTFTGTGCNSRGFGEAFFEKNKISTVNFITKWDHWYQCKGFGEALSLALNHIAAKGFTKVINYGGSMGGYAALSSSRFLRPAKAIAIAPQFSIDRLKVPFEKRWRREAGKLTFIRDDMDALVNPETDKTIIYDPFSDDAFHARLYGAYPNTSFLNVPFGGHLPGHVLRDCGILSRLVKSISTSRVDTSAFTSELRAKRSGSTAYWLGLAEKSSKRRPGLSLHACERGLKITPGFIPLLVQQTYLLMRLKRVSDAVAAAEHAVSQAPGHPAVWRALSKAQQNAADYASAVASAEKATELRREDADLHRVLLETLMAAGDYERAASVGRRAIELEPQFLSTYYTTSEALQLTGDLDAATGLLERAEPLEPRKAVWAAKLKSLVEARRKEHR